MFGYKTFCRGEVRVILRSWGGDRFGGRRVSWGGGSYLFLVVSGISFGFGVGRFF